MLIIQINVIHLQHLQAGLACLADVFAFAIDTKNLSVGRMYVTKLGGQKDPTAAGF